MTFKNTHFKTVIFISLTFYYHNCKVECETFTFEPPNLKTVLFKETDLVTRCWSMNEVVLLQSRRRLQDVIPHKIPGDFSLLLKYLKLVEETATKIAAGTNHKLLMIALGDVIGGYLQAIVIPIANKAYYAGIVDYTTVSELHQMLSTCKQRLSTDGGMWLWEYHLPKVIFLVSPLDIRYSRYSVQDSETACQELYIASNQTDFVGSETIISESTRIAIPYLDNDLNPSAIALPFKQRNLYSLLDPKSTNILVEYYILSMTCLAGKEKDIVTFNKYFHHWIISKVFPHLHKLDHWYPAFGAVIQIAETINTKEFASTNSFLVPPSINIVNQDSAVNTNQGIKVRTNKDTIAINFLEYISLNMTMVGIFTLACIFLLLRTTIRKKQTSIIIFDNVSNEKSLKDTVALLYYSAKDSLTQNRSKAICGFYEEPIKINQINSVVVGPYPTPLREA